MLTFASENLFFRECAALRGSGLFVYSERQTSFFSFSCLAAVGSNTKKRRMSLSTSIGTCIAPSITPSSVLPWVLSPASPPNTIELRRYFTGSGSMDVPGTDSGVLRRRKTWDTGILSAGYWSKWESKNHIYFFFFLLPVFFFSHFFVFFVWTMLSLSDWLQLRVEIGSGCLASIQRRLCVFVFLCVFFTLSLF